MNDTMVSWRSEDGQSNAIALRAGYHEVFDAIAEIDALGHRTLTRCGSEVISSMDRLVGVAMVRRSVTQFVGLRHLLEASSVEPSKLTARALFETHLAFRYLVHGGKRVVSGSTRSVPRSREARARYFFVAAERGMLYNRQALLDGAWGSGFGNRKGRVELLKEMAAEKRRLENNFPSQMKAYGALRCFKPGRKKVYYDDRPWFSFGFRTAKVSSVRALAARFDWLDDYELFYSTFSGLMHPRGISHDGQVTDQGFEVYHPYMAEAFELVATAAIHWQLLTLSMAIHTYVPKTIEDGRAVHSKVRHLTKTLNPKIPDGLF